MSLSIAHLIYGPAALAAVAYITVQVHSVLSVSWSLAYLFAINLVAFASFAFDKLFVGLLNTLRLRVPENLLIWELAFPGGIAGATVAMYMLQHKTGPGESNFRSELLKAYAVLATIAFVTRRWAVVSQAQVDAAVANLAGIVLNVVQMLLATVRAV